MNQKTKNILLILMIAVLIVVFTPIFGSLYKTYFGPVSGGFFWGPAHPEYIDGFFISFVFFVTLLVTLLVIKNKYKILLIAGGIFLFFDLISGDGKAFLVDLVAIIIAFILAQIILISYKKLKK